MKYDAQKVDMLLKEMRKSADRVEALRKKLENSLEMKRLSNAA